MLIESASTLPKVIMQLPLSVPRKDNRSSVYFNETLVTPLISKIYLSWDVFLKEIFKMSKKWTANITISGAVILLFILGQTQVALWLLAFDVAVLLYVLLFQKDK